MLTPSAVAQLLRSVAMLPPGCPAGLDRETAYDVLAQLEELQTSRRKGPVLYVVCPYCGERFDTEDGLKTTASVPNRPPRHPDPIAAADTAEGAQQAARALGRAVLWGTERVGDNDAYWVDVGRTVLWPVLLLARATARDMDDVRRLVHPQQMPETMATVTRALKDLDPGSEAGLARRQWALLAANDARARRTAFDHAYRMVHHWELSGTLTR